MTSGPTEFFLSDFPFPTVELPTLSVVPFVHGRCVQDNRLRNRAIRPWTRVCTDRIRPQHRVFTCIILQPPARTPRTHTMSREVRYGCRGDQLVQLCRRTFGGRSPYARPTWHYPSCIVRRFCCYNVTMVARDRTVHKYYHVRRGGRARPRTVSRHRFGFNVRCPRFRKFEKTTCGGGIAIICTHGSLAIDRWIYWTDFETFQTKRTAHYSWAPQAVC
jgi:hypothetical protein